MRPLVETPGYDQHRAVRCLVYDDDRSTPPRTLDDLAAISDILASDSDSSGSTSPNPRPRICSSCRASSRSTAVAIEDASLWHERPKIEFFERYVLVVTHAASLDRDGALVTHEIAIIAGRNYVVTLRAFPLYPIDEIEHRRQLSLSVPLDATGLLYIILDTIVDGFFPITERYDDRLVRLESRLFDADKLLERTEREIFQFKRALVMFRSIAAPMREVLLRLTHAEVEPLKPELSLYFRDVHDHVIRAIEQIDITRDLVNSTLDIHLATQSHRQNEVSKQLTIIATIFLPLTYITGFFGQNFGWMVNNIVSPQLFWYLGVGSQIVTLIILFAFFRSRRWL